MEALEKEQWLEVELQHPKGWNLAAEAGGRTRCYFRLDSKAVVKLEVKWERESQDRRVKPKTQPMIVINKFIEDYTKQLNRKIKTEVYERGDIEVCGHNAYFARWRGVTDIVTFSWVCDKENKVFLVNYYLEPDEEWEDMVNLLVPGILCHTLDRFWKYRLLGVEFKIPKGYFLQTRKLLIGKPVMVFNNRERMLVLHWSYFAKETLPKYKNLFEWSKKEVPKEALEAIKGLNYDKLKLDEKTGKLIVEKTDSSGILGGKTIIKTIRIWHDTSINRIFLAGYSGPQDNIGDLEELEKSISFELD